MSQDCAFELWGSYCEIAFPFTLPQIEHEITIFSDQRNKNERYTLHGNLCSKCSYLWLKIHMMENNQGM